MKPTLALIAAFAAGPAFACDTYATGDLSVAKVWSRATIGAERPAVVYMTIDNAGAADVLTAVSTPIAAMPMIHETVVKDGKASMPHLDQVEVPAQGSVALAPGGIHVMLMDLTQALKAGDSFPVTLTFRNAGDLQVEAEVLPITAKEYECAAAKP